jgi:deglycase
MARIACVLGPGFEDSEFKDPFDAFKQGGHKVDIIGLKPGQDLQGKQGKVKTKSDKSFDEVKVGDYDALFIPGGHSPDALRADDRAVRFVGEFDRAGKPIFAICHGPQLLMTARRVKGRTLTAWKTIQGDLECMEDVHVVDEPVVADRNWITSRQPGDIPAFVDASMKRLRDTARAGAQAQS